VYSAGADGKPADIRVSRLALRADLATDRPMRRRFWIPPVLILLALAASLLRPGAFDLAATSPAYTATLASAQDAAGRGVATFAFGDWGGLSADTLRTSAWPWKLATAALALQAAGGDPVAAGQVHIPDLYRRYGFHWPDSIGNWPQGQPLPPLTSPLGLNTGLASRTWPPIAVSIGNIGCAACHASVMYDATGRPDTSRVWLGAPNGSINLAAWTRDLYSALRDQTADADAVLATVSVLFPDTGWAERLTLRLAILPQTRAAIAARADIGGLLPFRASLAGATNGLDSLRNRLGLIPPGTRVTESVFNSVPDLGDRLLRTRLLNSGTYAIPGSPGAEAMSPADITPDHRRALAGIVAFFTVPSMGLTVDVARAHIPDAVAVTDWLAVYRPQAYPGRIAEAALPQGRAIYARACAACHGSYDASLTTPRLTVFPNWEGDVGTDTERARLLTAQIADRVNEVFGDQITARTGTTYAAPPLTGLWSSAPYLHNGSVPTLWHLMRPDARPAWFRVGGHRLDMARVGIDLALDATYIPWSEPAEVDTTAFGLTNVGHRIGFADLTEDEKAALLEYLKLL